MGAVRPCFRTELGEGEAEHQMTSNSESEVGRKAVRRRGVFLPMLLVACMALFWIAGAQAVHDDNLFELDGNALNGAATGEDWQNVCPADTPPGDASCTG